MYKKILFIFLAASLLLVAGCAKSETIEDSGDTIEKTDETLESATDEVNDLGLSDIDSLDEDLSLI